MKPRVKELPVPQGQWQSPLSNKLWKELNEKHKSVNEQTEQKHLRRDKS
jgi:hypothetical protein